MAVPRDENYTIEDILQPTTIQTDDLFAEQDTLDPTNQLLLGGTSRTSTTSGRTATVAAGEDIRPALESLKAAGGGTLILLAGIHKPTYNIVLSSNITLLGEGAGKTVIDFQNAGYKIVTEIVTTDSTGTITLSQGSKSVTGSGTSFLSFFTAAGETYILIPNTGQWYAVDSVASNTSLTLKDEYNGSSLSGYGLWKIGNPIRNIRIEGVTVKNNASLLDLVDVNNVHRLTVEDCEFDNAANDGIDVDDSDEVEIKSCKFTENGNNGIYVNTSSLVNIQDSLFINNSAAIEFNGVFSATVDTCQTQGNSFYALEDNNGSQLVISNLLSQNDYGGIYLSSPKSYIVNSTILNTTTTHGITLEGENQTVTNCTVLDCATDGINVGSGAISIAITGCVAAGNGVSAAGSNIYITSGAESVVASSNNSEVEPNETESVAQSNMLVGLTGNRNGLLVINRSGSTINAGNVVILDTSVANSASEYGRAINTTTTASDDRVHGVLLSSLTNTTYGFCLTEGFTNQLTVNGTTAIAVGDYLTTYTSAGIAAKATSGQLAFAIALEAYSTADNNGVIDAVLIKPRVIQ